MIVGSCTDTGGSLVGVILVLPVGVECVACGGFAFGSTGGSVGLKDLELVVAASRYQNMSMRHPYVNNLDKLCLFYQYYVKF